MERALLQLLLVGIAGSTSCSADVVDTPQEYLDHCGLGSRLDFTASELNRCIGECMMALSCAELKRNSRWLAWCASGCGGDFECDGGQTVISSDWLCDEEIDCLDGSDEQCR